MGDLSKLASGDLSGLGPTGQDQELIRKSIGAATDIGKRQLMDAVSEMNAQLGENLASRGVQGSSIEAVQKGLVSREAVQKLADLTSGATQQGSQALMNLPFQRAGMALNTNQILADRLIGAGGATLSSLLQERLAQGTSTQKESGASWGDLAALMGGGASAGKAIAGLL